MKFNTPYKREYRSKQEDFAGIKSRVDLTGYVPKEKKIKMMIQAGLQYQKTGLYDFPIDSDEDISDMECDPTRQKSFDLADASDRLRYLERVARNARIHKQVEMGPDSPSRSESGPLTPKVSKKAPEIAQEAPESKIIKEE